MKMTKEDLTKRKGDGEAQLEVEVYRRGIKIVVGNQEWLRTVLSRDGIEITEEMRECLVAKGKTTTAYTFAVGNGESVIYSKEKLTVPVLAHELTHAARTMLEEVGVNDDEAFAYVVEHLMEQAITCADVVLSPSSSDESRRTSSL